MKKLRLTLQLLVMVTVFAVLPVQAETPIGTKKCGAGKPFLVTEAAGRMHYAVPLGCSLNELIYCSSTADDLENDCEYRHEDGGTTYTSCKCQKRRYFKQCLAECGDDTQIYTELYPECYGIQ